MSPRPSSKLSCTNNPSDRENGDWKEQLLLYFVNSVHLFQINFLFLNHSHSAFYGHLNVRRIGAHFPPANAGLKVLDCD